MSKLLALFVGLLVFVAACGSSGSSSSGSSSKNSSDTASSGGVNDPAFSALYGRAKDATIRVTYRNLNDAGQPAGDPWTVSQRGADKIAYIEKDSKIVIDGKTATSCDDLQSKPKCRTVPGGPGAARAMVEGFGTVLSAAASAIASANGKYGEKSTDTIAGRSADCVTVTGGNIVGKIGGEVAKALGANTKIGYMACIDKNTGVLLKWQVVGIDNEKSGTVAIDVGQPKDSDFDVTSASTTTGTGSGETTTSGGSGSSTGNCPPITVPGSQISYTVPPGVPCP
jgi:hypothetical protein